jgi:tetratricopeptide (TPR) repeat protein
MRWLTRILKGPRASGSLLDSIKFDIPGWTLAKRRRNSLEWRSADGDELRACGDSNLPVPPLSELASENSVRAFYREEAIRHGGGIVCVEIVQAGGIRAVKVINKYERHPAYAYDGTLIMPFKNAQFSVTIDSIERGVTGERDALVGSTRAERGELEIESAEVPGEPGRIKGWFQDPYDPGYQGSAIYSMSDDDRLDPLFPDHPLSKIRKCLEQVQGTLLIDQSILKDALLAPSSMDQEIWSQPRRLLSSHTVSSLYLSFGSSLLQVGRFDDAEELLKVSLSELEATPGVDDCLVAQHLLFLGLTYDCQKRHLDAESALSRARRIFEQALGPDDPNTAQAMVNLARVYISLGRHDEAEPLFLQTLKLFNEKDASGSNAAVALNGLGLVRNARGLYVEAIPYFEQALQIFERVHGTGFIDCATVLRNMAVSLQHTGDARRAEEALNRARQIES